MENFKALLGQQTKALEAQAKRDTNITNLTKILADMQKTKLDAKLRATEQARKSLETRGILTTLDTDQVADAITKEKQELGLMIGPELKGLDKAMDIISMKISGFGRARPKSS